MTPIRRPRLHLLLILLAVALFMALACDDGKVDGVKLPTATPNAQEQADRDRLRRNLMQSPKDQAWDRAMADRYNQVQP